MPALEEPTSADGPTERAPQALGSACPLWKWLLVFKLAYPAFVLAVLFLRPDMDVAEFQNVMQRWPREGGPTFGSHLATWDAPHFLFLSEVGYVPGATSCAFYPLWPFLIRAGSWLTGGNHFVAGLILANLLSFIGILLFHRLVRLRFDKPLADWSVVFFLAAPGTLFLQFIYSEPLFFLLLMAFCLALQQERYDWVCAAGFFLPLTHAVGIFCVVPLLWHLVKRQRTGRDYLSLAGPVAGYASYFLVMALLTGNALEGFDAQKYWNVNSFWHLFDPLGFMQALFTPVYVHWYTASLLDRAVFIGLVTLLPAVWRLDKEWFLWTVMLGVLPAMISHFVSFTRYVQMAFPAFVAMAFLLKDPRLRVWRWLVLGVFTSLHIILLVRHINFRWAG